MGGRTNWLKRAEILKCQQCGRDALRTGAMQKFCRTCSEERDEERQRRWARKHPAKKEVQQRTAAKMRTRSIIVGEATSAAHALGMGNVTAAFAREIPAAWSIVVNYPFSYSASKNAIYSLAKGGHIFKREKANAWRQGLTHVVREAVRGRTIYKNKIWIAIFVQKPDHKGDAVNVVDLVCDALKDAIGLDDRWFCIKRLDWQITKVEPYITIGISQEECCDAQSCHTCGRILSREKFGGNAGSKSGLSRQCLDCERGRAVDHDATF